jgi:fructose-bisphosphate aldolase class II
MIKPGVVTGDDIQKVFKLAKAKKFALPAVNVVGNNSVNGVMETAKELNAMLVKD